MSGKTGPQPPWIQPHAKDTVGEGGWSDGVRGSISGTRLNSNSTHHLSQVSLSSTEINNYATGCKDPDLQRRKHPKSNGVAVVV